MPALYITEEEVRELIDMDLSIEVVQRAFLELARDKARNIPRARAIAPGIMLHTMSASAEYLGVVGCKVYSTTKHSMRFHVSLYDNKTGEMLALIEADELGQLRTGAASGVATQYMARPDASIVGLFGSGKQAKTQLKAVCSVRNIELVQVYSRDAERRQKFADEMSEYCATRVEPAPVPDDVAAEKDIVICATTAKQPVFDGRVLDEGTHLNVVGSNFLGKAEIDVATVRRADVVVCDSIEQCKLEAGDFNLALEEGVTDWRLMHELADVVANTKTGRATPENVTLFKSVGLAIEDVALAAKIYERAQAEGLGQPLPF